MYHLKRSFRSGCGSCCSTGCSNSSAIMFSIRSSTIYLEAAQFPQQLMQAVVKNRVHDKKVKAEDKDSDDHHRRGRLHLFARRRYHLAHLSADIGQEMREV